MQTRRPTSPTHSTNRGPAPVAGTREQIPPVDVDQAVLPLHLSTFNRLGWEQAVDLVRGCLDVPRWWTDLVLARPYLDYESLLEAARDAAYPFTPAELEAAVDHHLRQRLAVDDQPLDDIRSPASFQARQGAWTDLNDQYLRRFGRAFIVRAAGRSTAEIITILAGRLGNDLETEDRVVATQLRQIALLDLTAKIKE